MEDVHSLACSHAGESMFSLEVVAFDSVEQAEAPTRMVPAELRLAQEAVRIRNQQNPNYCSGCDILNHCWQLRPILTLYELLPRLPIHHSLHLLPPTKYQVQHYLLAHVDFVVAVRIDPRQLHFQYY